MKRGQRSSARNRRGKKRRRAARLEPASPPLAARQEKPLSTRHSLGFVYIAHVFRYIYGLILIPYYGRVLGPEEYGKVLAASALFQVIWLCVEYGCSVAGVRDLAGTTDRSGIAAQVGRQTMARVIMIPLAIAIGVGGAWLSPVLRTEPELMAYAIAIGINSGFNLGWYFQGTLQFRTQALLEVFGFALSLGFILLMVRDREEGARVLEALLLSGLIINGVAYALVTRQINLKYLSLAGACRLIWDSTALFASRGLRVMMANASTYLLSLFASAAQVGYYGPAERFSSVGLSFMQPVGQVLIGTVTRHLSSSENEWEAYRLMRNGILFMLGFGGLALLAAVGLSAWIIPLILGPGFEQTILIMQIFGFMFPFAAFNQAVSSYVLIPLRKDAYIIKATAVCAVSSIATVLASALFGEVGGSTMAGARVVAEVVTTCFLAMVLMKLDLGRKIFMENPDEISRGHSDCGSPRATDTNPISTR
ncbi:polysaccharide transporter, PST family [Methylomagnum ishizawai]|uniref:Polysaccharide transporter, PST family n=1 Tax=Methylomagnum ishizawai TaxID=1760988 RepID=A0A1Y6CT20_9GAMM|nr:oligosaccharide flippase family protein [Methylomagnum ishizawai]SMF93350.1 polysaccharide transporter, PST family [Methylomagnum ishizawai]